jgi:hypothetical protein
MTADERIVYKLERKPGGPIIAGFGYDGGMPTGHQGIEIHDYI